MEYLSLMFKNGKIIPNIMEHTLEIIELLNGFGKLLKIFNNNNYQNFYIFVLVLQEPQYEVLGNNKFNYRKL